MLVECGFVRATADDGAEYTFRPSFGRIAALGSPEAVVAIYGALHGPNAQAEAAYVLACLCDQDDPTPLIGWHDVVDGCSVWMLGKAPVAEQVILARHLMRHGIAGKAKPGAGGGDYSDRFDASEYVSAARVHLGLSSADAESLSMTEFQQMLDMKFPHMKAAELPNEEEYNAAMEAADAFIERVKERSRG